MIRWAVRRPLLAFFLLAPWPLVGGWLIYTFLGPNFHTIESGRIYRSAQPTPENLKDWVKTYDIRTVVNLRGVNRKYEWYQEEHKTAEQLGVEVIDVSGFSAHYFPTKKVFSTLIDKLERAKPPILIHCSHGCDRSSLAAGIFLLLHGGDLSMAEGQLSLWYGYIPLGRSACMKIVLDKYEHWLEQQKISHNPQRFRRWVHDVYTAEETNSDVAILSQ